MFILASKQNVMIFCHLKYRSYSNKDNISQSKWNEMVRRNRVYCKNFTSKKWIDFFNYLESGKFRLVDLPSFHPYWKIEIQKSKDKRITLLKSQYKECKKDNKMIKYYFNHHTTLKDIREKIKNLSD